MNTLKDLEEMLLKAALEIPEKALRVIGVEGKNFIQKNFEDEAFTDTSTKKWEKRKTEDRNERDITRYRTNRRGKAGNLNKYGSSIKDRALLVGEKTGGDKLKNSFHSKSSKGDLTVSFYTAKEYAEFHNEGTEELPQRQFMGKSEFLDDKISNKMTKELDKIFKK